MADPIKPPHKGARNDLTAEYVRGILDYDPETGVFTWKVCMARRITIGDVAGHIKRNGHRYIGIKGGTEYLASRLAWLVMTGAWPEYEIDHRDTNPSNDRWENLRPATSSQNLCNRRAKPAKSGYRGVFEANPGRWAAKITVNRKQTYLGSFDTPEEAHQAYLDKAREIHGEYNRLHDHQPP